MLELATTGRPATELARTPTEETERIYGLTGPFLGAAVLKLARAARREVPHHIAGRHVGTREGFLLWIAIPELAYRLGVRRFEQGERDNPEVLLADDFLFRCRVTRCLVAVVDQPPLLDYLPNWNMLIREVTAGNAVAIALDRFCPPETQSDALAAKMHEAWKTAFRREDEFVWKPELRAKA